MTSSVQATAGLPLPRLSCGRFPISAGSGSSDSQDGSIALLTDDDLFRLTGVRIGFTQREGGVGTGRYDSLNLATHVDDDLGAVLENRFRLMSAIGAGHARLIVPNQVHGSNLVMVDDSAERSIESFSAQAAEGADGIVVACSQVAALLCFADCMPVILVSPTGSFAVVHAGWRGVMAKIVPSALDLLCRGNDVMASECNAYIGPYIHAECFEVALDLAQKFEAAFGSGALRGSRHVDMGFAMRKSLIDAGMGSERIVSAGACTACDNEHYFSYRAQKGKCGRHGAIAVLIERR